MTSRQTAWSAVLFGLILACFAAFQQFKLPPVLPLLLDQYNYDLALAGGFMSIYALAGLLLSLPLARYLAHNSAFKPILIALGLMLAGNLLALVWPQSGLFMLAARGLEGIAFAVFAIAGPALVNRNASASHLPILVGLTAAWIPVGQISASLATPVVLSFAPWQGLWVLALGLSLAIALWTWSLRRQRPALFEPESPQNNGESRNSTHKPAVLSRREKRGLLLGAAIFALWSAQYFAFMTWLPEYLVAVHHLSLTAALWGYLLPVTLLLIFTVVGGALLRSGIPLAGLMIAALIVQIVVWFAQGASDDATIGIVLLVAYGAAAGITPTCLFAIPSWVSGQSRATAAFGIVMTGRNLGVLIGPVLLAAAFELSESWAISGPIFGGATLLAAVIAWFLGRQMKASA